MFFVFFLQIYVRLYDMSLEKFRDYWITLESNVGNLKDIIKFKLLSIARGWI